MKRSRIFFIAHFLILFLLAFAFSFGARRFAKKIVQDAISNARQSLLKETGISFSYKSLSPSILSRFSVDGIELFSNNEKLLEANRVSIEYNILDLLFRRQAKKIIIDGLTLEYEEARERKLLEKIFSLLPKQNEATRKRTKSFSLPFEVVLKNIAFHYRDKNLDALFSLKNASSLFNFESASLQLSGNANLRGTFFSKKNIDFQTDCFFSGTLFQDLEGSSFVTRFSNLKADKFFAKPLNIFFSYNDKTLNAQTMQLSFPLLIRASYNFEKKIADAFLSMENFSPSDFVSLPKDEKLFDYFSRSSVSATVSATYNTETKKANYRANVDGSFREKNTDEKTFAKISFAGNEKAISVSRLSVLGKNYDVTSSFSYAFKTMALSGSANANSLLLPNGNVLHGEAFFDSREKGFAIFAPQIFLGEKILTALQVELLKNGNAIDWSFEVSDYAHEDADEAGVIRGSGVYEKNLLQASVVTKNLYLDSAFQNLAFFLPAEKTGLLKNLIPNVSSIICSTELYATTDFKTLSYNAPFALLANTEKENQIIFASFDGNENSLRMQEFDAVYGSQNLHASGELARSGDAAFFSFDVQHGKLPYRFTGTLMPNAISLAGDYGFSSEMQFFSDGSMEGSLVMESFPISAGKGILSLTTKAGFAYTNADGFAMNLGLFEVQDASDSFIFHPHLALSGTISKYGAEFETITYSDIFSALNGSARLSLEMNDKLFNSARFELMMKDELSNETIDVYANATNPEKKNFSSTMLKENVYFDSSVSLRGINLNRFTSLESANNVMSAHLAATGTIASPHVLLSLDSASMMLAGSRLSANGSLSLEEKDVRADSFDVSYGSLSLHTENAFLSLKDFSGNAHLDLAVKTKTKSLSLPLELSLSESVKSEKKFFPTAFAFKVSSKGYEGNLLAKSFPFEIDVYKNDDLTFVKSSENLGIVGTILSDGSLDFAIDKAKPISLSLAGTINNKQLDLSINDVAIDLHEALSHYENEFVNIYNGFMTGSARITGFTSDPEFTGNFNVDAPDFSLPIVIPEHITKESFSVVLEHNQIKIPETLVSVKKKPVFVTFIVYFDRWAFDYFEVFVHTQKGIAAPIDVDVGIARFKGFGDVDLNVSLTRDKIFDIAGSIAMENTDAKFKFDKIANLKDMELEVFTRANLDLVAGEHVSLSFDPLLRTVIAPGTAMKIQMDQTNGTYSFIGDINLRSGDISYLNRNFYLKEGVLHFNDNENNFDPLITMRAETREKDNDGRDIRLILSATSQPLSRFVPSLSSIPAKSEAELQALLGQITIGDQNNIGGIIGASADYALQSMIGRTIENKLRDWLRFDIFSIRTNVLQNVLQNSISGDFSVSKMSIGNFLDNSTVYIGKYFGSAIYVDALMRMTYDETRKDTKVSSNGISFEPEFGFELESPFANIRLSTAFDVNNFMKNIVVPKTALTLSWRFSF